MTEPQLPPALPPYPWGLALGRMLLGAVIGVSIASLPSPFDYIVGLVGLAFILWAIYRMHPKRCEVCGLKPTVPVPRDWKTPLPSSRPAWWDIRPPNTKNIRWLCWHDFSVEALGGHLPELRDIIAPGPGKAEGPADPDRQADR